MSTPVAVVTGASGGIGAAIAGALRKEKYDVVIGARRIDKLREVADSVGARAIELDVTNAESVAAFCAQVDQCDVLVNNAGGAFGLEPIAAADDEKWSSMYETNVMGTMRMTRELLPKLAADSGHIVMIGSTAGLQVYDGGAGYTAVKHAIRAFTQTLRLELLGQPVRVTEVDPGAVETEFSIVRFDGDVERAAEVYRGMTPLTAEDVAECVRWAVTLPAHVNIDQIVVKPLDQATAQRVHRRS